MNSDKRIVPPDPEDDVDSYDPVRFWASVAASIWLAILTSKTVYEGLGGVWTLW